MISGLGEHPEGTARVEASRSRWKTVRHAGLFVLMAIVFLPGLGAYPLQEPDEGRYASVADGFAHNPDWLVPHLNGLPYYAKPPLVFWLAGGALKVLGCTEFAVRLPSALATLLTIVLLYHWGRRVRSTEHGLLAAAIFAGLPLLSLVSRSVLVDVPLMALTTFAMYSAWRALIEPESDRDVGRPWVYGFWGLCALAVLAKGPIGVVLPLASVGVALFFGGPRARIKALLRPDGLLLFTVIASPWYVAMVQTAPGYAYEFFVEQNLERFATGGPFEREGKVWIYVPLLLGAMLPWSALLPRAFAQGVRAGARLMRANPTEATREDRFSFYLLVCAAVPFVILSIAQSKRAYYVLPLLPPLALLIADARTRLGRELALGLAALAGFSAAGIAMVAIVVGFDPGALADAALRLFPSLQDEDPLGPQLEVVRAGAPALLLWTSVLGLTALGAALAVVVGSASRARVVTAGGMLTASALLPWALAPLSPLTSVRAVSQAVEANLKVGEKVLAYPSFPRGLPFYLGEPVMLYNASHNEFGYHVAPLEGRVLQRDDDALRRVLQSPPGVLVVVNGEEDVQHLRAFGPGCVDVLQREPKHALVRVHPRHDGAPATR